MSVETIIGGGLAVVRRHPRLVAAWIAVHLAVGLAQLFLMRTLAAGLVDPQAGAVPAVSGAFWAAMLPLDLALALFLVALFAAIVRAVAHPAGDGWSYLRFGGDELRLIGLALLLVVAAIVAEIAFGLLLVIVTGVLGVAAGGIAAMVPMILLLFLGFGLAIFAEVRISLVGAYTVLRRRIAIGEAWRATRGHFWTLFVVYLVLTLAFVIVSLVILAIASPNLTAAYASFNLQEIMAASREQMAEQGLVSARQIAGVVLGSVVNGLMLAVTFGAVATAAVEFDPLARSVEDVFS